MVLDTNIKSRKSTWSSLERLAKKPSAKMFMSTSLLQIFSYFSLLCTISQTNKNSQANSCHISLVLTISKIILCRHVFNKTFHISNAQKGQSNTNNNNSCNKQYADGVLRKQNQPKKSDQNNFAAIY